MSTACLTIWHSPTVITGRVTRLERALKLINPHTSPSRAYVSAVRASDSVNSDPAITPTQQP